MHNHHALSHLDQLEAESIQILREVAAEFERPVLLYSVGKDSSVLVRLAQKAFFPEKVPFPALHIDTGFKFKEMYQFRDQFIRESGMRLVVSRNEQAIAEGTNPRNLGTQKCCALLKTGALLNALREGNYQCAIGGARRDEEKSRAKERIFSFRDHLGQWDPKNQRPELWSLYNCSLDPAESIRVFPLSNWTELNIWNYILRENIPIVPLYFAKKRAAIVRREHIVLIEEGTVAMNSGERLEEVMCRFRTLGCVPCTGAIRSTAASLPEIISEMSLTHVSERATRVIDHDTEGSMETKKREGYF